ncbi:hypothetical protein D3C86_1324010 [compost metagenome]
MRDGVGLGSVERRRGGNLRQRQPRVRMLGAHLRQQHAIRIFLNPREDRLGIDARQVAELEHELAQRRDGVQRDATLDRAGGGRRERHVEGLVVRAVGLEFIGDVADEADQPRRVFDGVHALRRQRRMRGLALHAAAVGVDALVRHDHAHAGRLADDAAARPHATVSQFGQKIRRAHAADLLVERQRVVHRLAQPGFQDGWQQRQAGADEAFHVAGAPPIKLAVADHGLERVGGPVLAVYRHHVGVAGQHDAAVGGAIGRRHGHEQVGLVALRVVAQMRPQPLGQEVVAHGLDQAEIRMARRGVVRHQPLGPVERAAARLGCGGGRLGVGVGRHGAER